MTVEPKAVQFSEAIDHFKQKLNLPTQAWTDLWQAQHARAFVVAGAIKEDLISDLRNAVAKALEQGTTITEFRKDFDQAVAKHGWSYKGKRGWRTGVIFNTNLRTAYAAGKWQQAQTTKATRPYMRYVAILDNRTRQDHRHWHDTVLPIDDAWWHTHYPPNGWGCRCTVQTLSRRDLDRYGYKLADQAPEVRMVNRTLHLPEGKTTTVPTPEGIDPGWSYNVGRAAWGQSAELMALERHGPWEELHAPGPAPQLSPLPTDTPNAKRVPPAKTKDEVGLRQVMRQAIGGDQAVFADPMGGRVNIGQAFIDHMLEISPKTGRNRLDGREAFLPFLRELVEDPAEIWTGWAQSSTSGRVAMRRRYVKVLDLGNDKAVTLVADADGCQWSGLTFIPTGDKTYLAKLRKGLRIYQRP